MRTFAASFTCVAVGLWFGALVMLAGAVIAVFGAAGLERETAGKAAAAIFVMFGRAQLVVAAVALIGTFLGYVQAPPNRPGARRAAVVLFALLCVGAVGAVVFNAVLIPRIEELRLAGESASPEFKALHEHSEHLMGGITLVLLAATAMLPAFVRSLWAPEPQGPAVDA